MSVKALRVRIKQPSAHYRDPKVFQNDYINTLSLPTRTTIIGMITYLCDRRLNSNINIGVIGTYKRKELEFSRGEKIDFWENYRKLKKGKDSEVFLRTGEYYQHYKDFKCENSILNYEVLKEIELTIFFTCSDEKEFNLVKESLNNPSKYMNLGRKEDFVVPYKKGIFAEEVELEEITITNIRNAIKDGIKVKNTYVKVDLKDFSKYERVINEGALYALPSKYKDLKANKEDRIMEFSHYVYIGNDGIYPLNIKANVFNNGDSKEVFTWL